MGADHPLSRLAQALNALLSLLFVVHLIHSVRALRAHLRSPKVALQPSLLRQFHLPLSSCLRLAVLAVSLSGIAGAVAATASAFLQLPPSDDGLRFVSLLDPEYPFSTTGRACIAFSKLGPSSYVALKGFSYIFYFLKARTVWPLNRVTPLEKFALLTTLGVFGTAVVALWIVAGDRSAIDGQCQFDVPLWSVAVVLASDVVISVLYLYLFIAPLRATVAATRDLLTQGRPAAQTRSFVYGRTWTTLRNSHGKRQQQQETAEQQLVDRPQQEQQLVEQPPIVAVQVWHEDESELLPGGSTTAASTAPASAGPDSDPSASPSSTCALTRMNMSSQLELVMRKNIWSCFICVAITAVALGEICAAQATRQGHLLKLMWPLLLLDMVTTAAALTHLMHNSRKGDGFVAAAAAVAAVAGAAAVSDSRVHPEQLVSPSNDTPLAAAPGGRRSGVQLQLNVSEREHTAPSSRKLSNPDHASSNPLSPALQAQTHTRPSLFVTLRPSPSLAHVTTLTSSVELQSTSPSPPGPNGGGAGANRGVTASPGPASRYHVLPSGSSSSLMLPPSGMAYASLPLPRPAHAGSISASSSACSSEAAATGHGVTAAPASAAMVPLQLPGEATHTDEPLDVDTC